MGNDIRLIQARRSETQFERVVFAEVLVPDTPNVFNDYWTRDEIKAAAYLYAQKGYIIDVQHDKVDVTGPVVVVESFIARDGDPTFIAGSWVVGMQIHDDTIWQQVLDGDINGFSYEALISVVDGLFTYLEPGSRTGTTEPDPIDGHTHQFIAIVDDVGRAVQGGTDETNGHSHLISGPTVTDEAAGHNHRFNIVIGEGGI